MHLRLLPIDQLKPAPYNPRLPLQPGDRGWKKLARSLKEFELVQPIVWNERTGHIVSGHQRVVILRSQGVTEVDCAVVDLSLEREKALNVTLNNSAVASDWDSDRLLDLIGELQDLPDFDATLTGFDAQELRDLLLQPAEEVNAGPEESAEPGTSCCRVTLEIPEELWPDVRDRLDALLAEMPTIRLHVQSGPDRDAL
jgi:ParB-like chromosome segregation protein Spo0J